MDPGSGAYREDGDETLDRGSAPYREDGDETLDPGSRPESQRVASCANRLVVTPGSYREDGGDALDPRFKHSGKTE